jgi:hypothetical protein
MATSARDLMHSALRQSFPLKPLNGDRDISTHGSIAIGFSYCDATIAPLETTRPTQRLKMSGEWNTKYGTRRVRHDPPTLDEAIFAAIGITEDLDQQAEIAASLMGLPVADVQAQVKKASRPSSVLRVSRVIAGEQGAQRTVVVERRVTRKVAIAKRA